MLNLRLNLVPICTHRPAVEADIAEIGGRMRESDRIECAATGLYQPEEAVRASFEASRLVWTGTLQGRPEIMWGVTPGPILGNSGIVWMLSTETAEETSLIWLRSVKPTLEQMLDLYPRLFNFIDARNKAAVKWAKWVGFSVGDPVEYGPMLRPFHPITMER